MQFQVGDRVMHRYWDDLCIMRGLDPTTTTSINYCTKKSIEDNYAGKIFKVTDVFGEDLLVKGDCDMHVCDKMKNYILVSRPCAQKMTVSEIEAILGYKVEIVSGDET